MKSLRESLLDDDLSDSFDKNIKAEIKKFLKLNYKGYSNCKISREPNQDGKYEVSSTNKFICSSCASLTSLKGISKTAKVIDASNNVNLKSLDGLPEEADYVWVPKHFTEDDVRKICKVRDHVVLY